MGLREVSSGKGIDGDESAKVDIVAIHGLNPFNDKEHGLNTWRKPKTATGSIWLQDHLPQSTPNARIFIYEYNSNPVFSSSKERFVHQANNFLERLYIERKLNHTRPLVIIAHSLGGILAKQALVNAYSNPRYKEIYEATSGLAFFGTPHAGGSDALVNLGKASIRIVRGLFRNPPNDIMQAVTHGSLYADVLQENWRHQLNLYKIVSFYEGIGSIVSRESATIGLPGDVENIVCITADHANMCCFDLSNNDDKDNFQLVRANIEELYDSAILRAVPISRLRGTQVTKNFQLRSLQEPTDAAPYTDPSDLIPNSVHRSHGGLEILHLRERILQYLPNLTNNFLADGAEAFHTYEYDREFKIKARERYQGTCEWFCLHENYRWWRSASASSLLWLSGGSGLGKTTLLTHVVWQLQKLQIAHNPKEIVLFSFCESHVNDEAGGVISVLIHQLLETFPSLNRHVSKKLQGYLNPYMGSLTPKSLRMPAGQKWQFLCELVRISKLRRVFLVIDALDECKKSSQIDLIHFFTNATFNVSVLVSSKPNEGLRAEFSKRLDLSPSTFRHLNADDEDKSIRKDIECYLVGEVGRVGKLRGYSHDQRNVIENHLQAYCSGIFLIAKLMIKKLETAPVSDLGKTLEETPEDLPILYSTLLSNIPLSIRSKKSEIFKILMYTCEPLNVRELAFASQSWATSTSNASLPLINDDYIEGFRKDILLYGQLLKIRREDDIVTFFHSSVKEFLINQSEKPESPYRQFLIPPGPAQQEIAIACLRLLLSKSDIKVPAPWEDDYAKKIDDLVQEHLLLSYALLHWHKHLLDTIQAMGSFDSFDPELILLVQSIGKLWKSSHKASFRNLIMKCCGIQPIRPREQISVFEFFSWLGLSPFIIKLLEEERHSPLLPRLEDCVESALRLAVKGGHTATVATITEHFHLTSLADPGYEGIIADAAWSGQSDLVTRLQMLRCCNPSELGQATILAFTAGNHEALESLVKNVSLFQDRDRFGMTVLHRIFFDNFSSDSWEAILESAKFHIDNNGVAIGAKDCFHNTALHYAAYCPGLATPELLKALIQEGADPNARNIFSWTPLHLAARRVRSFDAFNILLSTGGNATIGSRTRGFSTPLHWAACRDYSDQTILLIRRMLLCGADPNAATLKGVTPLRLASESGRILGAFQAVYTRLDGVDHLAIDWDDPESQSIKLKVTQHKEEAASDNHASDDDESFFTASRGDGASLLTVGQRISRASIASSTSTLIKIKKPGFMKRLKFWR